MIHLKDRWFGLGYLSFLDYLIILNSFSKWDFVKHKFEIIEQVVAENWIL